MTKCASALAVVGAVALYAVLCNTLVFGETKKRKPGPHPESQKLENKIEMSEASATRGKRIYEKYCASCHGLDGKGVKAVEDQLAAPPSDLTDSEWKYGKTDGELFTIIRDGTTLGMQPFKKSFNDRNRWHVVNYIRSLAPASDVTVEAEAVAKNPIPYTKKHVAFGKSVYTRFCEKCHGYDGTGQTEFLDFLGTVPTDFTLGDLKYGNEDGNLFKIIEEGTVYDMESFGKMLDDDEIWKVIHYIKTFYKPRPTE